MHLIRMQKERQRKTAENRFLKIHHIIGGTYNDNGNKNRFYHHADREHYRTVWVLSSWGRDGYLNLKYKKITVPAALKSAKTVIRMRDQGFEPWTP